MLADSPVDHHCQSVRLDIIAAAHDSCLLSNFQMLPYQPVLHRIQLLLVGLGCTAASLWLHVMAE